eukprot:scaffold23177_cov28-Tisochrysis_lutea.AAC.3
MEGGTLIHCMFSRFSAIYLKFRSSMGPTFLETELPPAVPQPSVREGSIWKLYTSPMAPKVAGELTSMW